MPAYCLPGQWSFGNIMRGKERNVGAKELLGNVEQPVITHQAMHKGIIDEHAVV